MIYLFFVVLEVLCDIICYKERKRGMSICIRFNWEKLNCKSLRLL